MGFILVNAFLLVVAFVALVILWWVWPPDSPWSPWWQVGARESRESLRLAKVAKKDIIYELGCGNARFLVIAAREFGARGVGIEIDPLRYLTAKLNVKINKVSNKVTLKRGNFFDYNISDATIVFVYLVPRVLEKLKPKLFKELIKGTRIISYKYKFALKDGEKMKLIEEDKENEMYLYNID